MAECRVRYALIKSKVQENISCVNKARGHVKKEGETVDSDLTQNMQELEGARSEYWNLQDQRQQMKREINDLRQKRKNFLNQAAPPEEEKTPTIIEDVVITGMAVAAGGLAKATATAAPGTTAAFTAALLPGAILVGGLVFNYTSRGNESDRAFKASGEVVESLKMTQERDDKAQARILAIKEESLKKITMIKQNFIAKAFLGSPESLVDAQRQLERVGKHFQHILEIWTGFGTHIQQLSRNKDHLELLFIGFEEQPEQLGGELNKSIEYVKQAWNGFMDDCTGYCEESKREKHQLYGFLTEPVDELSTEECDKKRKEILEKMKLELENFFIGRMRITDEI